MRAELYRALSGIATPREVDAMELWQVAVLMGADEDARPANNAPGPGVPVRRGTFTDETGTEQAFTLV